MTKCRVLLRGFGTFPAGSAVRVKSRFALYSPRGAFFDGRVAVRFAVVLTLLFALFAVVLVLRLALFVEARFVADFVGRAGRVLVAVRLVAIRRQIRQEHAPAAAWCAFQAGGDVAGCRPSTAAW